MEKEKKTAIFSLKPADAAGSVAEKYRALGGNTGNLVFDEALSCLLDADRVYWDTPPEILSRYDRFVTTSYIWIRKGQEVAGSLKAVGDKPLIPMSVGLQADDYDPAFPIHPQVVKELKAIEERCVIGCRGAYTAEILHRHGIRNLMVIGCPSVYPCIREGTFVRQSADCRPQRTAANFATFWRKLREYEVRFLTWLAQNRFTFIEQTQAGLEEAYWTGKPEDFRLVSRWLEGKKVFFSCREWQEEMMRHDFCLGYRFHGNVMAVRCGIPALFLCADSRVRELCEFFRFPMLPAGAFDETKPIEYWYEKADYSGFHQQLGQKRRILEEFCRKNSLPLRGLKSCGSPLPMVKWQI
ncbi:MAG TPA: polysaccharide pyruvyl transferase family protein [Candidatus Eisenbergiella intestinipullorum]|nr:polysaccharide pyruvyl transferase family protein [Candidatus Eisenbergiella intestinipullorum]